MLKIILNGCNGKMGQVITRLVSDLPDAEIVAGFDINDSIANTYSVFTQPSMFSGTADVLIDFSHPDGLAPLLSFALDRKMPTVVATTGLSTVQVESLKTAAMQIPIFFTANMSLGVNLMIDLAKKAAKLLEGSFNIEIIEKHHNQKIDAPSGTALAIADAVSSVLKEAPEYVYDRHSSRKKRTATEIGLHAVRGGTIVGEHEIIFAGTDEIISISHSAASKEVFAVGSIRAAQYLAAKPAGLYNMGDLVEAMQ